MTSRERRIEWIRANHPRTNELVIDCYRSFGLDWFTDEQIEDMVREGIGQWRRHIRFAVRNRKAMNAKQEQVT